MKLHWLSFFFAVGIILCSLQSTAQVKVIHGMVTTFDSIPLIGANIKVKSSGLEIKTDTTGRFSIQTEQEDKLKVTAHGFLPTRVKLDPKTKVVAINLRLKPGEKQREIAIGYGYVKDKDKLNALASLHSDDMDFSNYTNMFDLIRGRFAGVQVQNNGDIIIRGVNSINLSSAALIVVDGVTVDKSMLSSMSPINVKSINIIKDGSSAIYGSRGANGVVVIETKKGGD